MTASDRHKDSVDELLDVLILRRRMLKMSIKHVADRIGVGHTWLRGVENGQINPPLRTLLDYAHAVGMELTWTLRGKPD